jgi:hypothetical protein
MRIVASIDPGRASSFTISRSSGALAVEYPRAQIIITADVHDERAKMTLSIAQADEW